MQSQQQQGSMSYFRSGLEEGVGGSSFVTDALYDNMMVDGGDFGFGGNALNSRSVSFAAVTSSSQPQQPPQKSKAALARASSAASASGAGGGGASEGIVRRKPKPLHPYHWL